MWEKKKCGKKKMCKNQKIAIDELYVIILPNNQY